MPALLSGASARMLGSIITSPLDALKARVQFAQKSLDVKQAFTTTETARMMWQGEGIAAFYRGLPARLIYVGPAASISFLFYEQFRVIFHRPKEHAGHYLSAVLPLAAAGVFRVLGTVLRTPFDVVRQRMQVMGGLKAFDEVKAQGSISQVKSGLPKGVYRNTFDAMRAIVRQEGIGVLFSGVGVTVLRDIPFSVTYFLAYESFKTFQHWLANKYAKYTGRITIATTNGGSSEKTDRNDGAALTSSDSTNPKRKESHTGKHFLAGAGAAACAVLVSNPLDVMKTRLQTQGSLTSKRYYSIAQTFNLIRKEEGWRGFTRGLGPRCLYLCPSAAITFSLYEFFKPMYTKHFGRPDDALGECIDHDGGEVIIASKADY